MDLSELLAHHIIDHPLWGVTKHTVMLWFAAGLLALVLPLLARRWPLVPSGFRNLLESFVVFLRDEVILTNTGDAGRPYLPYFLTLFFFILTVNLLGVIPGAATATGNVSVTGGLALCTFVLINFAGIRKFGVVHHIKNFVPHGLPFWLVPFMLPLEIMGLFTKCFALTIRLFANMIAGHIVILVFLGMIFLFQKLFVIPLSIGAAVGFSLLEIFVAFLQAYIFTLLSAIFVGASLNPH